MGGSGCRVIEKQHAETAAEAYFRVAIWIGNQRNEPKAKQIQDQFGVHRATACRWLNAWRSAMGVAA